MASDAMEGAADSVLKRQEFDSVAFETDFLRVVDFDTRRLSSALAGLASRRPLIVDAKISADRVDLDALLQTHGFRKVCMQVELVHSLVGDLNPVDDVEIDFCLPLTDVELAAHARNFTRDRFRLDVRLPIRGHDRLYEAWIRNSLGGRCGVAHRGRGFCSFTIDNGIAKIDLVSSLDPGLGHGRAVVSGTLSEARRQGAAELRVVTECENRPAITLYRSLGFDIRTFSSVFHFVDI